MIIEFAVNNFLQSNDKSTDFEKFSESYFINFYFKSIRGYKIDII